MGVKGGAAYARNVGVGDLVCAKDEKKGAWNDGSRLEGSTPSPEIGNLGDKARGLPKKRQAGLEPLRGEEKAGKT